MHRNAVYATFCIQLPIYKSQIFLTWLQSLILLLSLVAFYSQAVTFADAPNCLSSSSLITGIFHKAAPNNVIKQTSRGMVCLPIEWNSDLVTISHNSKVLFYSVHNHPLSIAFQAFYSLSLEWKGSVLSDSIHAKTKNGAKNRGILLTPRGITELQLINLF